MRTQSIFGLVLLGTLLALGAPACVTSEPEEDVSANAQAIKPALDAPALSIVGATQTSIDVQVCAGPSGAPAGFSVQWMTADAYGATGWDSESPDYCAASFSGVPAQSTFSLGPGVRRRSRRRSGGPFVPRGMQ
jgi:hypothetical protein